MKMDTFGRKIIRGLIPALAIAGLMLLAGCATGYGRQPVYGTRYGNGNTRAPACVQCGVVQSVQVVRVDPRDSSHLLGTIIGAVAGAAVGNQVGGGSGNTLATVAGAIAGGAVGHHVGKARNTAYRVVVRLYDGRIATVTQRGDPNVHRGDRVQIRNNTVHLI